MGPSGQAGYLFSAYARLYLLEKRVGNKDDAEVALTKARYWHLKGYQTDADWRSRVTLHEFLSYQTPEWIEKTFTKLDKGHNKGNGPKYLQYLTHTQPATAPEPTGNGP